MTITTIADRNLIADKIASAIDGRGFAARSWVGGGSGEPVRVYVSAGRREIGYVEILADGRRNYSTISGSANERLMVERAVRAARAAGLAL